MYAIRNKENHNLYFHNPTTALDRKSKMEGFVEGEVPRLFKHRAHANLALNSWVRGGPSVLDAMRKGLARRDVVDWEIITVTLIEVCDDQT